LDAARRRDMASLTVMGQAPHYLPVCWTHFFV